MFHRYIAPTMRWIRKAPRSPAMAVNCFDLAILVMIFIRSSYTLVFWYSSY